MMASAPCGPTKHSKERAGLLDSPTEAEIAERREADVEDKLAALLGAFDLIPEGARAGPDGVPA